MALTRYLKLKKILFDYEERQGNNFQAIGLRRDELKPIFERCKHLRLHDGIFETGLNKTFRHFDIDHFPALFAAYELNQLLEKIDKRVSPCEEIFSCRGACAQACCKSCCATLVCCLCCFCVPLSLLECYFQCTHAGGALDRDIIENLRETMKSCCKDIEINEANSVGGWEERDYNELLEEGDWEEEKRNGKQVALEKMAIASEVSAVFIAFKNILMTYPNRSWLVEKLKAIRLAIANAHHISLEALEAQPLPKAQGAVTTYGTFSSNVPSYASGADDFKRSPPPSYTEDDAKNAPLSDLPHRHSSVFATPGASSAPTSQPSSPRFSAEL